MRKILLYLLAAVLSFGIWFCIGTITIPIIAWALKCNMGEIPAFFSVIILISAIVYFLVSVSCVIFKKCKFKFLSTTLFFAVPFSICFLLMEFMRESHGGRYGDWHKDYYVTADGVYNKFGKEVIRERNRIGYSENFFYDYDYENYTGSIYDINSKQYILEDTNLKYAGEVFEDNGLYSICLKQTGQTIVPPKYEFIDIMDGFIKAKRNGKYGILSSLGEELTDFIYSDIHHLTTIEEGICIEATESDDVNIIFLLSESKSFEYLFLTKILTTTYDVCDVCDTDEFIVKDNSRYREYCVVNDDNERISDWYEEIKYDKDTHTYKAFFPEDGFYGEWRKITLND